MNEILFFLHIILILFFTLGALRLGKEALITCIALEAVLANLFVLKQMTLFGLNVTCSDVFSVGCLLGANLLNEYYGKETAKRAVWLSFGAMLFFGVMSKIHLLYNPNIFDGSQLHFYQLLTHSPRILLASVTAFLVSGQVDVQFYAFLKRLFNGKHMIFRAAFSMLVAQLIDTVTFGILGLYGILSALTQVIVVSYIVKIIAIASTTPFAALSKKIMKGVLYE